MVAAFLTLSGRIRRELVDIRQVATRVEEAWQRARGTSDDFYLDSVALNLHGFYAGLERIFELIADEIDGSKPASAQWHADLLRQMSSDVPRLRAAVVSPATAAQLDAYRGFRHIVRNVYTFNLDADRLQHLVESLPAVSDAVAAEIAAFAERLEEWADVDEP